MPDACNLAPALVGLRSQNNAAFPFRSKAADGGCGDAAHMLRASDHNLGLALDLTKSDDGPDLYVLAGALLEDDRVTYVIFDGQIKSRVRWAQGWRAYDGANPHRGHLHVSIRADARDDLRRWDLGQLGQAVDFPPGAQPAPELLRVAGGRRRRGLGAGVRWLPRASRVFS